MSLSGTPSENRRDYAAPFRKRVPPRESIRILTGAARSRAGGMPTQMAAIELAGSIAVSRGDLWRHGTQTLKACWLGTQTLQLGRHGTQTLLRARGRQHGTHRRRLDRSFWNGLFAVVMAIGFFGVRATSAQVLSAERQNELLQSGIAAFDQAVAVSRESPQKASELYRQAANNFEALVDSGVHNESIEFNLGNAYFRLKDLGRAILHYRRALLHSPGDSRAAANLAYAREKVEPQIAATGEAQLVDRLLFWNRNVSRNARYWLATLASIAGWSLLLAQLRWKRPALLWLGAACVVLGLANSLTVYVELNREGRTPAAVMVMSNTVLRQGRGENYEPILKQSLGSGVEVTVLDRRADWCEVRLVSGQTGWLPISTVAIITP